MVDVLKHELVPKHEVLSKAEAVELLKKFNTSPEKLPKIFSDDPVVIAIDAKPGDILKIKRKSPTAGEIFYYRVVVER
jgi:DNA-directed RNA polymerase subunit H